MIAASILGRRYERLLLLTAPISLFCFLLLFVSLATINQDELVALNCYKLSMNELDSNNEKYELLITDNFRFSIDFALKVGDLKSNCYRPVRNYIDALNNYSLADLKEEMLKEIEKLSNSSIKYGGIELKEKTYIYVFGNAIEIETMALINLSQFLMAPILILWLGSLYITRFRETKFIGSFEDINHIFPHIINVYPATSNVKSRVRLKIKPYFPSVLALAYAVWRVLLLTIFVAPAVISYLFSIIVMDFIYLKSIIYCFGFIVWAFSATIVLVEFFPWHFYKTWLYDSPRK